MSIEIKNINKENEQFEDSILYLSGQEERNARLLFSKKLEELITQNPNVPDLYHKLGLCLYGLGAWEAEDKRTIEISFHRAILLDESSIFSKIFLIHFYFDIGEFNLSLKLNSFIDSYFENSTVPVWRLVKILQIKLSCMIYLKTINQDELEKELDYVINQYINLDPDDIVSAKPTELLQALVSSSSEYNLIQVKDSLNKIHNLCEIPEN